MNKIICPGCGWVGVKAKLVNDACPTCKYENNSDEPYRLLTLAEMLEQPAHAVGTWNDVDMGPFLRAVQEQISGTGPILRTVQEQISETTVIAHGRGLWNVN